MNRTQSFQKFLSHFSEESLPLTLSDENVVYFSTKNRPLPQELIRQFIQQGENKDDFDELTEYIPCFQIPDTDKMHALVYWRGRLLEYDYILITFNNNGVLLGKKVIAGIRFDGSVIKRSIATIDEDWIINIVVGEQIGDEKYYNPNKSQLMAMELLANGEIIFSLQE